MKKNTFIKGTIILLIGTIISRILGIFIRIAFTRITKEEGISLLNIIMPTYVLVVNLTSMGLPLAISIITSKGKYRSKNIFLSIYPFVLLINFIMMFILIITSDFISSVLLKSTMVKPLLIAIALTLPFISISSILRGIYLGKQKMDKISISSSLEQIIRLILIISILPLLKGKSTVIIVSTYLLFGIVSELITIIYFLRSLPNKVKIHKEDLIPNIEIIQSITSICVPTISSRLINNILLFLEPIIIMHILVFKGLEPPHIRSLYGIFNMYSLSILMIPSFIINTISTSLTPEISKNYQNKSYIRRRLKQILQVTLFISLIFYIVIFLFPKVFLKVLYDTTKGITYIKVLTPFFILYNLTNPLISTLNGIGKTNIVFKVSLICILVKTIIMVIFLFVMPEINGLVVSEIIYIVLNFILLYSYLDRKKLIS